MLPTYTYDPSTGHIEQVDINAYSEWIKKYPDARRIAETTIGECWVSTVFLGIDHSFGIGDPVLFETMVFWDAHEDIHNECERCRTLEEAKLAHERMCSRVTQYTKTLNKNSTRIEMWP